MIKEELIKTKEHLDNLEVLSDIYEDLSKRQYPTKKEKDLARLKMKLIKKEMLLLNYLIKRDLDKLDG